MQTNPMTTTSYWSQQLIFSRNPKYPRSARRPVNENRYM